MRGYDLDAIKVWLQAYPDTARPLRVRSATPVRRPAHPERRAYRDWPPPCLNRTGPVHVHAADAEDGTPRGQGRAARAAATICWSAEMTKNSASPAA